MHLAVGLFTSEKAELATYQLKDVAQASYVQWRDNKPLRGGPFTWEIFKKAFLDRFYPREMREDKVVEFINLCQGGRSLHEYSFWNSLSCPNMLLPWSSIQEIK